MSNTTSSLDYICPACRGEVYQDAAGYKCPGCERSFPMIYGIPDFRLNSDAYLSLEAERAKARILAERALDLTYIELLDYYYSITADVPPELVSVYKRSIYNGPLHLAALAHDIDSDGEGAVLDAGCGSGSLLLALAGTQRFTVGLDIAMRWLVICRKRLLEQGLECQLVCADLFMPPFRDQSFSVVAGIDLIEHTHDIKMAAQSLARLIQPGGRIWLTVSNRYTLGPHPSTRLWAIGYLPKRLAGRVSRILRGIDSFRNIQLTTPRQVITALKEAGFAPELVQPKRISGDMESKPPLFESALISLYRLLCRWTVSRRLLVWIGPISEIMARMPTLQRH